jgi:dienelactone hydrolase
LQTAIISSACEIYSLMYQRLRGGLLGNSTMFMDTWAIMLAGVAGNIVFWGGVSMAEVVLFHSVLGLRPGVIAAADRLRDAGHTVHTPDYYDGEVFDDLAEGQRKEKALGYQAIARRAREAVAGLPAGLVFTGFSLGAVHAELLAATRPGALGAVLMHGAVPVETLGEFFGVERWPEGVPVQVHYATEDPWVEAMEEVAPLRQAVRKAGAAFEEHAYPGSGHLFADPELPEYDRSSSEEMWRRVLAFLDRIDARGSDVKRKAR